MVAYAEGKSNAPIMNLKVRFTGDTAMQQRLGGVAGGCRVICVCIELEVEFLLLPPLSDITSLVALLTS